MADIDLRLRWPTPWRDPALLRRFPTVPSAGSDADHRLISWLALRAHAGSRAGSQLDVRTGRGQRAVLVWDGPAAARRPATHAPDRGTVTAVSVDGRWAALCEHDGTTTIYGRSAGSPVTRWQGEGCRVGSLAVLDAQTTISVEQQPDGPVWLRRRRAGAVVAELATDVTAADPPTAPAGAAALTGSAVSASGEWAALAGRDGWVDLWSVRARRLERRVRVGGGEVVGNAGCGWSDDGRWLALGSDDDTLSLFDQRTGREWHRRAVCNRWPRFSTDATLLAVSDGHTAVELWDLTVLASQPTGSAEGPGEVAWSTDGAAVATRTGAALTILDRADGSRQDRPLRPTALAWAIAPDATVVELVESEGGELAVVTSTGADVLRLGIDAASCRVCSDNAGGAVAVLTPDRLVTVDLLAGTVRSVSVGNVDSRRPLAALHPDRDRVALGDGRRTVVVPLDGGAIEDWTITPIGAAPRSSAPASHIRWTRDGRSVIVLSGSADAEVRRLGPGVVEAGGTRRLPSLRFSRSRRLSPTGDLVAALRGETLLVTTIDDDAHARLALDGVGPAGLAWAPDGDAIAVATPGGPVIVDVVVEVERPR